MRPVEAAHPQQNQPITTQATHAAPATRDTGLTLDRRRFLSSSLALSSTGSALATPREAPRRIDGTKDGHIRETWPAWRRAIARYTWGKLGIAPLSTIDPGVPPQDITPRGADWMGRGMTLGALSWCGATWDDTSYELTIPVKGGHTDDGGNEPYRLALAAEKPVWRMMRPPSGALPGPALSARDGKESTGLYADGRIRAQHTYNNCIHVPGRGPLITRGSSMYYSGEGVIRRAYLLDDAGETSMVCDYGSVANPGASIGMSAWDPDRRKIWIAGRSPSGIIEIDPDNWSFRQRGMQRPLVTSDAWHYASSLQSLVGLRRGAFALHTWRIGEGLFTHDTPILNGTGSSGLALRSSVDGFGSCWCDELNCVAVYQQTSRTTEITSITPTGAAHEPWVRGVIPVDPANQIVPPPSPPDGLFSRFSYSHRLKGFLLLPSTVSDVYFFAIA